MPIRTTTSHRPRRPTRAAFTLVEVLMVVAIIGILVGLIVPAVSIALTSVKRRALAIECQTIANAIEQYKSKYGEYPPDGSNRALLIRHLQKAFPQIQQSEIDYLIAGANSTTGGVMDPSEALVFFLGGFSSNPAAPFTGPGGPFTATPTGSKTPIQYNIDRQNAFFEFKQTQLSVDTQNDPDSNELITVSVDERDYSLAQPTGFLGDLMPVYRPTGKVAPYVYFDSRSYVSATAIQTYSVPAGTVGPFLSAVIDTKTPVTPPTLANRARHFRFVNDKSFQLISAGLDDLFGTNVSGTTVYVYRPISEQAGTDEPASGEALDLLGSIATGKYPMRVASITGFRNAAGDSAMQDNCTNFSDGTLADSLQN